MVQRFVGITTWVASLSLFFTAFGQDKAASPMAGFGGIMPMMLIMFAVVYFLMIRPEQKKQKARQAMMSNIKKGDKVLTTSGMIGTVGSIKDSTFMVKIAENTVVEFAKSSITSILNKDGSEKQSETEVAKA